MDAGAVRFYVRFMNRTGAIIGLLIFAAFILGVLLLMGGLGCAMSGCHPNCYQWQGGVRYTVQCPQGLGP